MKNACKIVPAIAAALVAASITVATASVAHAGNLKIAYVDMNRALNEVEDGRAAKAKLKAEFDKRQKGLDKLQESLKKKKEDFDKRASMMKPDVRATRQEELQRDFYELQQTYMTLQRELIEQETALTQGIGKKLRAIIEKMGDRDNYHVILNIGDTVLYHKRHLDVTDDVVREYNKRHKNSGS